jgi:hypothetical protein
VFSKRGNESEELPVSETTGHGAADEPEGSDTTARSSQQDTKRIMDFVSGITQNLSDTASLTVPGTGTLKKQ